jgi:hypothetical protein
MLCTSLRRQPGHPDGVVHKESCSFPCMKETMHGGTSYLLLLQASLKRKHWDGGANARHSALFEQQMRLAAARAQPDEAVRDQVCKETLC